MIRGLDMNKETAYCSNIIVADQNDEITKWICEGLELDTDWLGPHFTIGFVRGGCLIGGLIYHDYRPGCDVWWTIYAPDKRWCSKKVLKFMFGLAFEFFGCRRISMITDVDNYACLNLAQKVGFKTEGVLRKYRENGKDAVLMGLLKNECKFLGE